MEEGATLTIKNGNFEGNTAYSGGFAYVYASTAEATGAVFDGNMAKVRLCLLRR